MTLESVLSFVFECALIMTAVGAVASLAVATAYRVLRPALDRRAASVRADVVLILAVLPMALALAAAVSASAPSMLHAMGLRQDHCGLHGHHAHLCMVHFGGIRTWLAALGSCAAADVAPG